MTLDRRQFLRGATALTAGVMGGAACTSFAGARDAPAPLPRRPLGRTGVELPILGLGGFHLGACADALAARALVTAALDEGLAFFDNAESYQDGQSETWMGEALHALGARERVFLMTKTYAPETRSADSARRHLEGSLARLRTDHLDLWQLHAIQSEADVDRAFGEGGAMEAIVAAKEEGRTHFVGVTGHVSPRAHLRAIEWWDRGVRFDVMQMPVNPIDAHQVSFQQEVLPALVERGIGVLAMKTSASGALLREGVCSIEECLRYVWSLPVSLGIVGMETPEQVRANAALARAGGVLDEAGRAALLARIAPRAALELEWYKRA